MTLPGLKAEVSCHVHPDLVASYRRCRLARAIGHLRILRLPRRAAGLRYLWKIVHTCASRSRTVDILRGDWFFSTTASIKELGRSVSVVL